MVIIPKEVHMQSIQVDSKRVNLMGMEFSNITTNQPRRMLNGQRAITLKELSKTLN
jgi:hypothetical protein